MTPRKATANRRGLILKQASSLFARHGYEGTSIRTIAGACGVTEAAIYRHFRNKADLFGEVIKAKAEQHDIRAYLAGLKPEGGLEDLLRAIADHILSITRRDPDLMRLISYSCLGSGEVGTALFQQVRLPYIEFLTRELEARAASGEAGPIDPFITARCFVGMVMDCAINTGVWSRITGMKLTADEVINNNVPIFARGLAASGRMIGTDTGEPT